MRVFIAGATGAVGRPLVTALLSAGHSVVGMTRTSAKARWLEAMGAESVVADGLDAKRASFALSRAKPDAVVHEMTDLSGSADLANFERTFAKSNELRVRGTDILLAAAAAVGVKRFIAQSYCGWPYEPKGRASKTEADPLDPHPLPQFRETLNAIKHVEKAVTASAEPEGVVLRYGSFYGPQTGMLSPALIEQIANRRVPLVGSGEGWWSFIHVDDAAAATVRALERGVAGNVYNIVDDEPAQVRDWLPALATLLGAKQPYHIPAWMGRIVAGEHLVMLMTKARAGCNKKAKMELGWQPTYCSWKAGFKLALEQAPRSVAA